MLTHKRMRIAFGVTTVLCCASQVYFLMYIHLVVYSVRATYCTVRSTWADFTTIQFIMREVLGFLVPALITALLNMAIIRRMHKHMAKMAAARGKPTTAPINCFPITGKIT